MERVKKVLLFARDPGGANTLVPLYEKLRQQYELMVYGKDVAVGWFKKEGIFCKDIRDECKKIDLDSIQLFLKSKNPYFIITGTSLDDYTERYLWKSAEALGLKSFAILDQWTNVGIRFSKYGYKDCEKYERAREHPYMPHRILVMDRLAKEILQEEGIAEDRIWITGQPHFERIYKQYESGRKILDESEYNVLFVSEPITQDYEGGCDTCSHCGYNEKSIFSSLHECLNEIAESYHRRIRIIVKPHPREKEENWTNIINAARGGNIIAQCDTDSDKYDLLQSADLVCGMSSMLLLEAVICKKNILSIVVGLKGESPFILDRIHVCKSCRTKAELMSQLERMMNYGGTDISFDYIKNPSENVIAYIEREMRENE